MYQDKSDLQEEEDKRPLELSNDFTDGIENDHQQSSNLEVAEQKPTIEKVGDKETGTEEVIEIDKVKSPRSVILQ